MSNVVAVSTQKGGAGKTTIAVHLARGLAIGGKSVLVIDADSQRSASLWRGLQSEVEMPPVYAPLDGADLGRVVKDRKGSYEYIIIDAHPRVHHLLAQSVGAADLVLIPTAPSVFDVAAAREVVELYRLAAATDPSKRAAFVVNKAVSRTRLADDIAPTLQKLYNLPVLKARIGQRSPFVYATGRGLTVFETEPETGRARAEMAALVKEVARLLK